MTLDVRVRRACLQLFQGRLQPQHRHRVHQFAHVTIDIVMATTTTAATAFSTSLLRLPPAAATPVRGRSTRASGAVRGLASKLVDGGSRRWCRGPHQLTVDLEIGSRLPEHLLTDALAKSSSEPSLAPGKEEAEKH